MPLGSSKSNISRGLKILLEKVEIQEKISSQFLETNFQAIKTRGQNKKVLDIEKNDCI